MTDCSIIIINYNTFSLTVDCIKSIREKVSNKYSFEIIVVDNASSECDARDFIRIFPEIVLIINEANIGFSKANNVGIQRALGKYILLLNSDTVLLNDAVTSALDILKGDPSIGVLSGQLQFPNGDIQSVAGVFPSISRELMELFRLTRFYKGERKSRYYLYDSWDYSKPVEADWLWGAFLMFRKEDLKHFPDEKLHEDFFMYYEDVQWCYFFKKVLKKKVYYSPKPLVKHYLGKSDNCFSNPDVKYFERIVPNEYRWLGLTKGRLYARCYYLVKSLFYLSLRRKEDMVKARKYLKFVLH